MHSEAVSTIIEQLQQNPRNVFVEGIQGAGKTTLLNALQQKCLHTRFTTKEIFRR